MNIFTKSLIWILSALLALFLLAFAIFPTVLSTRAGKEAALTYLNKQIPGHLSIDKLRLNWLGNQRVEGLVYENQQGKQIFNFEKFETNTSLLYLLFGGRSLSQTIFQKPYLILEEKESAFEKKTEKREKKKKKRRFPFGFKKSLLIQDGTLLLSPSKIAPVTLTDINIEMQDSPEFFHATAKTEQLSMQGEVVLSGTFLKKVQIHADIKNFPVAVLDELAQTKIFTEALGNELNLNLNFEKEKDRLEVEGSAESPNLHAYIQGETRDQKFYLNSESHLVFAITPSLFRSVFSKGEQSEWSLANKTDLSIELEKAIIPLNLKNPDFRSIVLEANAHIDRSELLHKTLGSYSLNNFNASIHTGERLEIAFDGEIKGKESSQLGGNVAFDPEGTTHFSIHSKGFPTSLLELASPEIAQAMQMVLPSRFDFSANGLYMNGEIDTDLALTSLSTQLQATLKGSLCAPSFQLTATYPLVGEKAKILGPSVQAKLNGTLNWRESSLSLPILSGKLEGENFTADLRGKIGSTGEPFSFDQVHLVITGGLHKALLHKELENGSFFFHVDGSKNLISAKIETTPSLMEANLEIQNYIHDNRLDFKNALYTFATDIKSFPTALLNPFMPEGIDLTSLIGPTLTLDARGNYFPNQEQRAILDLKASSQGFFAKFSCAVDEKGALSILEDQAAQIHLDLSPARYLALIKAMEPQREPVFLLRQTTPVDLTIQELNCPTLLPKELKTLLCRGGLKAKLQIGPMVFQSQQTEERFVIQGISGSMDSRNVSEAVHLAVNGRLAAANIPQSEQSAFSFQGDVFNFFTPDGKFNLAALTLKGELTVDLLPIRQLTGMIPMEQPTAQTVQALLGDFMNVRLSGEISQLTGMVTLDMKSSNFKAKLPLQIQPNAIYLRDKVEGELTLNEEVNEAFLKEINPLIQGGAYSANPVKVYIEPEGFVIPIRPFDFKGVQIEKAIFDLGKIYILNDEQISSLLKFLQLKVPSSRYIQSWFTPIFMSLKNGVATYKRFDALIGNQVHIALWGKVNLLNNRVNMVLGIAPSTLKHRFNIPGLTKKDMFQVKMRGTTDNLELDWSSAYTRIAIIIARTAGGGIGYIVGGIVEQIIDALGEEPTPASTTDPLPWTNEGVSTDQELVPTEAPPKKNSQKSTRKLFEFLIP